MGTQSGMGALRMADAILKTLGGDSVSLVFPLVAMPDDPSAQLGLVDPGTEQIQFTPVVVTSLPTANTGPRRRLEIMLAAEAVANAVVTRNVATADALFDSALGVMHCNELLHIEGFTPEYSAGMVFYYKVVVVG